MNQTAKHHAGNVYTGHNNGPDADQTNEAAPYKTQCIMQTGIGLNYPCGVAGCPEPGHCETEEPE